MLAGHSSHDRFPISGLKHIVTSAAIVPYRPSGPENPSYPTSFTLRSGGTDRRGIRQKTWTAIRGTVTRQKIIWQTFARTMRRHGFY